MLLRRQREIGTTHGQRQRTWHRFQRFDHNVTVIVVDLFSVCAVGYFVKHTVVVVIDIFGVITAIGGQHGVVDARSQRVCV